MLIGGLAAAPPLSDKEIEHSVCLVKGSNSLQPVNLTYPLLGMIIFCVVFCILFVMFFDTPYKRLNKEKEAFALKQAELSKILENTAKSHENATKSQSLYQQLNKFYNDTSSIEQELNKLKSLRVQQEEMINQCKVNIETLNSNQV